METPATSTGEALYSSVVADQHKKGQSSSSYSTSPTSTEPVSPPPFVVKRAYYNYQYYFKTIVRMPINSSDKNFPNQLSLKI